ncbi:hypothetical protein BGZ65_005331 [Modicella reniformis]|uniref:Cytidine deaminase n=1 Tax=Modicella reniformis TaxID=1440133 RepID=A0A9P6IKP1_9FUNG|nr:hypothetical protein BGZ65_005331 [Modicella reniformis]
MGDIHAPLCERWTVKLFKVAMLKMRRMSEGHLRFVALAVSCDYNHYITPCGICRQFMNEFGKNLEIFFVNNDRTYKHSVLADLLPFAFGPEDLPSNDPKE